MPISSVVVLAIDRLGAGWLGPYGNTWLDTPNFNRLAAQGAVVETALADSPDLAELYRGWWSGCHILEPEGAESPGLPTIAARGGRSSFLLTDDPPVANHRLASGFSGQRLLAASSAVSSADEIEQSGLFSFFDAARAVVQAPDRPTLVWLHSRGLAGAWDAPLTFRFQFADDDDPQPPDFVTPPERMLAEDFDPDELLGIVHAYAGQVALADMCLGLLLDVLDEHPLADQTLLVVTAPRGYPLGEHRRVGPCDQALFGELLHVPLLVRWPDQPGPARLHSIVQPRELSRLICERSQWNDNYPAAAASQLLHELATGTLPPAAAYSFATGQRAVRTPAWFLRQWQNGEETQQALYAKPDDRWEANEIASRGGDVAELLASELDRFESAAREGRFAELPPLADLLCDRWR